LGTPTQLFVKNDHIIRILPGYDKVSQTTNWISDKTRFSFDGMFSPEKIIYNFLENNGKKSFMNMS
jgi:NADH dehydrogenase/NADH:ubiquinone oxidoreductase subunit G